MLDLSELLICYCRVESPKKGETVCGIFQNQFGMEHFYAEKLGYSNEKRLEILV